MAELTQESINALNQILGRIDRHLRTEGRPGGGGGAPPRLGPDLGPAGGADDLSYRERATRHYGKQADEVTRLLVQLREKEELMGRLTSAERLEVKELQQQEDALQRVNAALQDNTEDLGAAVKALDKLTEAHKRHREQLKEGAQIAENYENKLFGLSGEFGALYTRFIPKSITSFKSFGKSLVTNIFSINGVISAALKLANIYFNLAFAADRAASSFKKSTGAGEGYTDNIERVRDANILAGVSFEDSSAAMAGLYKGYTLFNRESEGTQDAMASQVAVFGKLGVSAGTTIGIMGLARQGLGMTGKEALKLTDQLKDTAFSLHMDLGGVLESFSQAAPQLAFYGDDLIHVFRKLQMQAKDTGLSVSDILGIVGEGFDTFDGAASKVGRMNALLGGPYLNSIDMLNASEGERLDMLKQSMDASGRVFSDLSKYEQKAFAAALGTDVLSLRKAMGALTWEEEERIKVQEKAEKRARKAKDAMESLALAFENLFKQNKNWMKKVVEGVRKFAEYVQKFDDWKDLLKDIPKQLKKLIPPKVQKGLKIFGIALLTMGAMLLALKVALIVTAGILLVTFLPAIMAAMAPFLPIIAVIGLFVVAIGLMVAAFLSFKPEDVGWIQWFKDWAFTIAGIVPGLQSVAKGFGMFFDKLMKGETIMSALKGAMLEFANSLTYGKFGWVMAKLTGDESWKGGGASTVPSPPRTRPTSPSTIQDGGFIAGTQGVAEFASADDVLALKPGGGIGSAFAQIAKGAAEGAGANFAKMGKGIQTFDTEAKAVKSPEDLKNLLGMGPGGVWQQMASTIKKGKDAQLKKLLTPPVDDEMLRRAITDPLIVALAQLEDKEIIVQIGDAAAGRIVTKGMNSRTGASAVLPWLPGRK